MSITIATCNVNGVRAAYRKGMGDWLAECGAEVVALQEVRAPDEILRDLVDDQWQVVSQASEFKGRAGVAILSRHELTDVQYGLSEGEPDVDTGRWIEASVKLGDQQLRVVSAYLHSGVLGTEKQDFKMAHLDKVSQRLSQLQAGSPALVMGDFNIVHTERDIKNWKGNHNKTAGVLDEEIAYLDAWFGNGWVDVQRQVTGAEEQGPYTWWSQRGKAFDNNAGWRIDYQMAVPQLAEQAQQVWVDRADSYDARWSDHAPLLVSYDL